MSDDKPTPIDQPAKFPRVTTKRVYKRELKAAIAAGKEIGDAAKAAAVKTVAQAPAPAMAAAELAKVQNAATREVFRELSADYADTASRRAFHKKMWEWLEGPDKELKVVASKILSKGLVATQANVNIKTDPFDGRSEMELKYYIDHHGRWPEDDNVVLHAANQRVN